VRRVPRRRTSPVGAAPAVAAGAPGGAGVEAAAGVAGAGAATAPSAGGTAAGVATTGTEPTSVATSVNLPRGGAAVPVYPYTSMRAMSRGTLPSMFFVGTVRLRYSSSPTRVALISLIASGIRTIGASGGPFLPQPASTGTAMPSSTAARQRGRGIWVW
jgi:hypothetical protein